MSVKSDIPLDQQALKLADSDDRHWAANETPARGKRLPKGIQKAYNHSQYEVHNWFKRLLRSTLQTARCQRDHYTAPLRSTGTSRVSAWCS